MSALPKNILRQLASAHGWLSLGNWKEADAEIEAISPEYKRDPLLLNLRVEIYRTAKAWTAMAGTSKHLINVEPEEGGHWLNYSYGLRRSEGLGEAKKVLEKAKDLFPQIDLVWFNLACYCAQLSLLDEARAHLARAFELNPGCLPDALKDPDLEPLWKEISEI